MSFTAVIVPRIVPVTFDRPTRGVYAVSTSRMRPSGRVGAQHHLERVAAAPILQVEAQQALAIGHSHRAEVVQSLARRPPHEERERAVGHARVERPRCLASSVGVARARVRPRRARAIATMLTSSPGSIDASASQNATIGAVAASRPACAAEPNPRRGSVTTVAPSSRATSADRSVEPLSTTIAR